MSDLNHTRREISNTVGKGFENTVHFWRTLRHPATNNYMSQRTMRRESQPYTSRETAPTVFEIPLTHMPRGWGRCFRTEPVRTDRGFETGPRPAGSATRSSPAARAIVACEEAGREGRRACRGRPGRARRAIYMNSFQTTLTPNPEQLYEHRFAVSKRSICS